jgi:adenine phosphoribosyltransferase
MSLPISAADRNLLTGLIRDVPDFPQPGIMFRDITPLLSDPIGFRRSVELLAEPFTKVNKVVAIESRGFILGAPVALALHAGLVPVRKVGRLPAETIREEYSLEYGSNVLEIHRDAIKQGDQVLIVDDVLATGGTVRATANLIQRLGGTVAGVSLLIELAFLNGRERLTDLDVRSVLVY